MIFISMEQDEDWMKAFNKVFDRIDERYNSSIKPVNESNMPKFNSIEEFRRYYNSIPFSEWLNKVKGKYDI